MSKTVKLGKFEPMTYLEVFEPRYHDKTALLNGPKVKRATTQWVRVKFTKAKSMEGDWVVSRSKVMKYPLQSNGTIQCYAVPLSELNILEIDEKDIRGIM